jgi:signal peptidase I
MGLEVGLTEIPPEVSPEIPAVAPEATLDVALEAPAAVATEATPDVVLEAPAVVAPEATPDGAPGAPTDVTPPPVAGAKSSAWKTFLFDTLETLLLAIILFVGINTLTARVRVDGFSMQPTLQNGEYVLVNRLAYRFGKPERGDIVVFRFPMNPKEDLIKRVIGLPGEEVTIAHGQVYINGNVLEESYIAAAPGYSGNWTVPDGSLFVLGDNRNDSADSHSWGLLPVENVIGKAVLIYWPFTNLTLLLHGQAALAAP